MLSSAGSDRPAGPPGGGGAVAQALRALHVPDDLARLARLARRLSDSDPVPTIPHGPPAPPPPLLVRQLTGDDRELDIGLGATLLAWEDDPHLDVEAGLARLDLLSERLRARLRAAGPHAADQLAALNHFFFEEERFTASSPRASTRPEERLADLLLPHVLRRRRGHCVGLSTAYLALATRAGLPVFGVSAPGHFFVRWDGAGLRRNVEPTARGLAWPDATYVERYRIGASLVDRGVYLQTLRRREVLVEVLNNRANFYWDRGDVLRAGRDLDRIVQVSRNFLRGYLSRGFMALSSGDLEGARRELVRALEIDPDCARAHLLLGEVHLREGRLEAAEEAFERAAGGEDPNPLPLTNLGRVRGRQGRLEEAIALHERALQEDPRCHVAWNNLGVSRRAVGELELARQAFRRALRLAPDFVAARENLLYLSRGGDGGLRWSARPAFLALCRHYEGRLRRAPGDEEARAAYVRLLCELGLRVDRALEVARSGVDERPSARAFETLAGALERSGRTGEAATALERAIALDRAEGGRAAERLERALLRLNGAA